MDTDNRNASIKAFVEHWKAAKGNEKSEAQKFWMDFFNRVLGKEFVSALDFEGRIKDAEKHTRFFDVFIRETRVLIEHKSRGIALDTCGEQSGMDEKLTPFQQAKNYAMNLAFNDPQHAPLWIITCNFDEFRIYALQAEFDPETHPEIIRLEDLPTAWQRLQFIADPNKKLRPHEEQVTVQAGRLVGELYDALLAGYDDKDSEETLHSLNVLCVRLVFCLYAEDAGVFDPGNLYVFHDYIKSFAPEQLSEALEKLFEVLDTPVHERKVKNPALQNFPYVNGGLFSKDIDIDYPTFTAETVAILADKASAGFDWRGISPTIFGAVFESTLNPETRRQGGMHYTSIENIHKVIDPLFLDDLKAELAKIAASKEPNLTRRKKLTSFIQKIAGLKFFDPACGSGNFLTETYICLRRLENDALRVRLVLEGGGSNLIDIIKVSIGQFYGIELNDFAVSVATTALWIAESQMFNETRDICEPDMDFLPLRNFANIKEGNALRMDWTEVVKPEEVSYIMGNPPFVGNSFQNEFQREDSQKILVKCHNSGRLDYVCCWYVKAAKFIENSSIRVAFVSTNSISQGEQALSLWPFLFSLGIKIQFAWQSFKWVSEATGSAAVYCIIVCFSKVDSSQKKIFTSEGVIICSNINAYLINADDIFIKSRTKAISKVPHMTKGNQPTDGGNLIIEKDVYDDFLQKEPNIQKYVKKFVGSREFINNLPRWCIWLVDVSPNELKKMPLVMARIEKTRQARLASPDPGARRLAEQPTLFRETYNPKNYIIIPSVSSERREYVPIGFLHDDVIPSNLALIIPNANLYHFGILTSSAHNAWMRTVAGRLEMRYRYSAKIVYNNFPWPEVNDKQQASISKLAKNILDARDNHPTASLATLYDPNIMPQDLRKAHNALDAAVLKLYGLSARASEPAIVAKLFAMYAKLTNPAQ